MKLFILEISNYLLLVGGAADTRIYWSTFLQDTDLLVFMVDASDTDRLSLAASILKELLGDPRMETVPILIIASKQVVNSTILFYNFIMLYINLVNKFLIHVFYVRTNPFFFNY